MKRGYRNVSGSPSISRRSMLQLASAAAISLGFSGVTRAKGLALNVTYYDDFAPYSFIALDNNVTGIFIDALNEVGHRIGVSMSHHGMPWARAQQQIKEGQADAFCTLPSVARKEYADFSNESLLRTDNVIVFSKSNPKASEIKKITTAEDLRRFTIGTYLGDSRVDTLFKGMTVDVLADMSRVLLKVEANRNDIAILAGVRWKYYAKVTGLRDKLDSVPFSGDPSLEYHLGIRKGYADSQRMLSAFDKAVIQMKKDGTVDRILAIYTGDKR